MIQPSLPLALSTERREKKRGRVIATSVKAFQGIDARTREQDVLYFLRLNDQRQQPDPTSAELANFAFFELST